MKRPTLNFAVKLPELPHFVRLEGLQDAIPVAKLTAQQAEDLAEAWKQAFIEHCKARRECQLQPHDGRGPG